MPTLERKQRQRADEHGGRTGLVAIEKWVTTKLEQDSKRAQVDRENREKGKLLYNYLLDNKIGPGSPVEIDYEIGTLARYNPDTRFYSLRGFKRKPVISIFSLYDILVGQKRISPFHQ
jgi:hypothetical protein